MLDCLRDDWIQSLVFFLFSIHQAPGVFSPLAFFLKKN